MTGTSQHEQLDAELLTHWVERNALSDPYGEAVVDGKSRLTHSQLKEEVDAFSKALFAAGVKREDRVAMLAPPSLLYWVSFLACASIGAIWVGLNPRYRAAELRYVLADADPAVVLYACDGTPFATDIVNSNCRLVVLAGSIDVQPFAELSTAVQNWADFVATGAHIADEDFATQRSQVSGSDPALIVYTSGSTGTPKGALLHQRGMVLFAATQNAMWPVSSVRVLNYLPINHIGCVVDVSIPVLVAGGTIIFMQVFEPAAAMQLLVAERVTIWGSVPTVFLMQLSLPEFGQYDLSCVELIVWGGAALPLSAIKRLRAICPRLATNYGMTETSSAITALAPVDDLDLLENSVGSAFPGVSIKLVNALGDVVSQGEVGEILTKSKLNFLGYWKQDAGTAAAFDDDGYFRTGDLALMRSDGHFQIVGRSKEMFKSGGYNIYPREIEACIEGLSSVYSCVVVGVPDDVWQEAGVAFVVLAEHAAQEDLVAYCRAHLANYKIPKRFEFLDEMPLLPIGKVDRMALKSLAEKIS